MLVDAPQRAGGCHAEGRKMVGQRFDVRDGTSPFRDKRRVIE